MDFHKKYALTKVINAKGVYTPLGVSRSVESVAEQTGEALKHYFDIEQLLQTAGGIIADSCGANFATIVHCASAANILSIAATMTGSDPDKIAQLPDATDMKNKVVISTCHLINYGHPIEQDIRIAGALPLVAGDDQKCTVDQLRESLGQENVTALLFVSSRLTSSDTPDLATSIAIAREFNIPVIVDAAAMDIRMAELVASGADLLTFSAQKYLAAPTAGIVVGDRQLIDAVNAQGKGIGRPMKPSKEAILGTIAAFEARSQTDQIQWSHDKKMETQTFADSLQKIDHIEASLEKGLAYGNFWRAELRLAPDFKSMSIKEIADELRQGDPVIYCGDYRLDDGVLEFEVIGLDAIERQTILTRIAQIIDQAKNTRS